MPLNIGLVYDLRSEYLAAGFAPELVAEFDSDETIDSLAAAISSAGHRVDRIGNARSLCARLVAGDSWDLVFNIAEGLSGRCRESQVPALLELFSVPYTFSDPLVLAATLDKAVAKRLLQSAGVATPRFAVVADSSALDTVNLAYPLFAKPLAEGSGKGVSRDSIADSPDALASLCQRLLDTFHESVLVEEYLPGREFTVAVLGNASTARILGVMEVSISDEAGGAVYSYESKEKCEQLVSYSTPEPGALTSAVETLALDAYRVLECRDAARLDIRCDRQGRPSFMEVNPLPGLHPTHSDLPMIATAAGVSYNELIAEIINNACERQGIRP